ncbi:MAG: type VI secretion system tip protein VgrG ['Candidatus Kapabacteria' thiocyanatum]|uniref:Type IV secretion protein Rhs n=1 Tax=Candidatus Kapaibacterium thiocyanatum TaxID=1895771 RepID=A0A1M3KZA3_9BACT|nr:type VI secretion system tip protein VgrG ['Candidatus Kapabacteria' thiocyanatum]OJX57819.1 MAG: type IV secretion protein Rhs ['Candidatus Kapabacteria' thiocyanatum]
MSEVSTIPTPATPDVCTVAILVEGQEIPGEYQVQAVSVSLELNRIPSATIHLKDGEASQGKFKASDTDLFVPGKKIEIQLGYRSQNESVFKGIVVKHAIKIRKTGSMLIVECRDESMKLTRGRNSRYFVDKKDSDIMQEIIDLHGLQHDVVTTDAALKEVVQYDATDWDFILCRAEANGCVVITEGGKIRIVRPDVAGSSIVTVGFGTTVLELDAEIDARLQSKGVKAKAWNATDQEVIETEAAEPSTTENGNLDPDTLADVVGGDAHELRHGGKVSEPELQAWADGYLLKERLAKVRGRVKFQGLATVLPGTVIEVTGIGERFEGKMYVSGVRHSVSDGNWETDAQIGLSTATFAETFPVSALPAAGLLPSVHGLQMGVVTALENDPDGEDRIKVRIPMISASDEGIWARLSTLDAGKERGTYYRPEIGDEVVVGFLDNDPRYPVVLGMCHSSAKPSPEPAKDDNHLKGYVSREKMKMTFDDEKKIVRIETPAGNRIALTEEDSGIVIEDQNGNRITMDADGIVVESVKDLKLKAAKNVVVEGLDMELKAQTGFKASGSASAEISGASTTIQGSATTVIKGGLVQIN